jgi:hypothetical protein
MPRGKMIFNAKWTPGEIKWRPLKINSILASKKLKYLKNPNIKKLTKMLVNKRFFLTLGF